VDEQFRGDFVGHDFLKDKVMAYPVQGDYIPKNSPCYSRSATNPGETETMPDLKPEQSKWLEWGLIVLVVWVYYPQLP
jgi:hypothetical protein